MNNTLELKGNSFQQKKGSAGGPPRLPKGVIVRSSCLQKLKDDLFEMQKYWSRETILNGALVSVYYKKNAAKSNRITGLLSHQKTPNDTIVGAKFSEKVDKHIITHFVSIDTIKNSISDISEAIKILDNEFNKSIGDEKFNEMATWSAVNFNSYGIPKTKFQNIIVDAHYAEKFDVEHSDFNAKKNAIVTIYRTGNKEKTIALMEKLGIRIYEEQILDDTTIRLDKNYLDVLIEKAPYLVAMATEDLAELAPSDSADGGREIGITIPPPADEPTIGVIDTLFEKDVYFGEWVEYHHLVDENISTSIEDYRHGTAVSSIIVDGAALNPNLDDGCGRFKVRHFGVAVQKAFSSFTIIRQIKSIIVDNPDIRVWNLSLGSNEEVNKNFISAEGAVLDQIQYENDVIFVIAGTNKNVSEGNKKIGAPADSINSVVVNSVDFSKQPAPYSREGGVLLFFTKPDVSYYGGTSEGYINACEPFNRLARLAGTSFAAPWIARKLSYLIDIVGLKREVAKALLIDSAIGWRSAGAASISALKGHGVVPQDINSILNSADDEIKFVVTDTSEAHETYNYNFPVPVYKGKHPYFVKATFCYFPKCSRSQGVDYTNTELDVYFGRIDNEGKFKSIDSNKQSLTDEAYHIYEKDARKQFGKWDNVKHIGEEFNPKGTGKKVYDNQMWGMRVVAKERLNNHDGRGIPFGAVVTLKEIKGVNRIQDFIEAANLRGWLVNSLNIENRIDIYQTSRESIELE